MKMCFFEFTAIPDTSPRYRSVGSFRKFGTESNGISGTSAARTGANAAALRPANAISKYRFKVASWITSGTIPKTAGGRSYDQREGSEALAGLAVPNRSALRCWQVFRVSRSGAAGWNPEKIRLPEQTPRSCFPCESPEDGPTQS